jgi:hypothetical protein
LLGHQCLGPSTSWRNAEVTEVTEVFWGINHIVMGDPPKPSKTRGFNTKMVDIMAMNIY